MDQQSLFDVFDAPPPPTTVEKQAPATGPHSGTPHAPIFTPGCRLQIYAPADRQVIDAVTVGPAHGHEITAVAVDYTQDGRNCRTILFVGSYNIHAVEVDGEWRDFAEHFGDIVPRAFSGKG